MKTLWKLIGYGFLALLMLTFLYVGFLAEAAFKEWMKDLMPFLQYVKHAVQWIIGVWFLWRIIEELGKLWDKRQQTLEALLVTSQETTEHLRRLRDELDQRDKQQQRFTWS